MENHLELLEAMAENEILLSELYTAFGKQFQEKNFWLVIAAEETAHAAWIRKIIEKIKEGKVAVEPGRFKIAGVQIFKRYVLQKMQAVQQGGLNYRQAVAIALDIEKSLLEDKCFEIFETDDPALQGTFQRLKAATEKHKEAFYELWEELESGENGPGDRRKR